MKAHNTIPVPRRKRLLWLVVLALVCLLALKIEPWKRFESSHPPQLSGLIDHTGQRFDPEVLTGRYRLIYFGFTHCPQRCQTAMASLAAALEELGALNDRVQALYVTVDPERDTPQMLDRYLGHFTVPIIGLTGSIDAVSRVAKEFGVDVAPGSRRFFPSSSVSDSSNMDYFLLNPDGVVVLRLPGADTPQTLSRQLRTLLDVVQT